MASLVLKGTILHAPTPGALEIKADSYLVCERGLCVGVFQELPAAYAALPVEDFGNKLILPGYTDLHLHASQYADLGLGMDMELLDWLEKLTFPEEARFADLQYAKRVYAPFTARLRQGFTTNAVLFATVHTPATLYLMEALEASGLYTLVGRVNMDRNCPDYLREADADAALANTETWLARCAGHFDRTAPILTPRFVPSCTGRLMAGLGTLAGSRALPVQSHLSENLSEIDWVRRLHPDCANYAAVYNQYGLLGERTVMAHCVHLTEAELDCLCRTGTYIAHCPTSNSNVRSGIAPICRYLDAGAHIGLGSDISGGHTLDMSEVLREALRVSKLLWRLGGGQYAPLRAAEAFYLATRGGGAFFGDCGAFLPGFRFDAVVVDDRRTGGSALSDLEQRFEKYIYLCTEQDICAKYVAGVRLF